MGCLYNVWVEEPVLHSVLGCYVGIYMVKGGKEEGNKCIFRGGHCFETCSFEILLSHLL